MEKICKTLPKEFPCLYLRRGTQRYNKCTEKLYLVYRDFLNDIRIEEATYLPSLRTWVVGNEENFFYTNSGREYIGWMNKKKLLALIM